jgi:hypothetical protein
VQGGRKHRVVSDPTLRSVQRRKNINTRHYLSYGLHILRKSRKRFEPSLAAWTIPEMTNYFIIQEFCLEGCNNFVVASNTLDAKQGHAASFFHRGQQAYIGLLNDEDLACRHGNYVTAFGTINHVSLNRVSHRKSMRPRVTGCIAVTPPGSFDRETSNSPSLGSTIPANKLAHHSQRKE